MGNWAESQFQKTEEATSSLTSLIYAAIAEAPEDHQRGRDEKVKIQQSPLSVLKESSLFLSELVYTFIKAIDK